MKVKKLQKKAVKIYQNGEYENAIPLLEQLGRQEDAEFDVVVMIDFCKNVIFKNAESVINNNSVATVIKSHRGSSDIRCKYCGRYTMKFPPNYGLALNNCNICRRTYPSPNAVWDSKVGLESIYEERVQHQTQNFILNLKRDIQTTQ